MDIQVEKLDGDKIKVSATVDAKDIDSQIGATYKDFAKKYNFPGFRKGKAPRPVIDNAFGKEAIMATVTENVINDAYPEIIEEERIFPVGSPDFSDAGMVEAGKPFTFEFEQSVKSIVELSSYDPVEVELPISGATEADVEEQMKSLLAHYNQEEATDEWAKETMGFENLEDMREQISTQIAEQKAMILPQIKENVCKAKLIERFDGDVPDAMAEQMESNLLQDFFTQLQRAGMTFDGYLNDRGIDSDQFKADVKLQAQDECKKDMALDSWANHKGIEATDEEVSHEFEIAGLDNPKSVENEWRKNGRLHLIREGIMRSKAMQDIMENAKVTEVDFIAREKEKSDSEDKASEE